jgi:hypothetical protein
MLSKAVKTPIQLWASERGGDGAVDSGIGKNAKCRDVCNTSANGAKAEVTGHRQSDAIDPHRTSAR